MRAPARRLRAAAASDADGADLVLPGWLPVAPVLAWLHREARGRGCSLAEVAAAVGVPLRPLQRRLRLRWEEADVLAVQLGLHPVALWPQWAQEVPAGGRGARRAGRAGPQCTAGAPAGRRVPR